MMHVHVCGCVLHANTWWRLITAAAIKAAHLIAWCVSVRTWLEMLNLGVVYMSEARSSWLSLIAGCSALLGKALTFRETREEKSKKIHWLLLLPWIYQNRKWSDHRKQIWTDRRAQDMCSSSQYEDWWHLGPLVVKAVECTRGVSWDGDKYEIKVLSEITQMPQIWHHTVSVDSACGRYIFFGLLVRVSQITSDTEKAQYQRCVYCM